MKHVFMNYFMICIHSRMLNAEMHLKYEIKPFWILQGVKRGKENLPIRATGHHIAIQMGGSGLLPGVEFQKPHWLAGGVAPNPRAEDGGLLV